MSPASHCVSICRLGRTPAGMFLAVLALLASVMILYISAPAGASSKFVPLLLANGESVLVYVQTGTNGQIGLLRQGAHISDGALMLDEVSTAWNMAADLNGCEISGLSAAPNGHWLASQSNCQEVSLVQIIQPSSGQVRSISAELGSDSLFLGWSPTGDKAFLLAGSMGFWQAYRLDVATGEADPLAIPDTVYNLSMSPDGQRIIYSLTKGLGYGSETWIADADGQNPRRVLYEPSYLVLFPRWSPDGSHIVFIRIPDTNVPFPMGELWVMDGEGNNPVWISAADGGRGYEPVWSPDGSRIAFVGRENPDDPAADQIAALLSSNIYVADLNAAAVFPVTQFTNALSENPSWSPDGAYLAFDTNAGGVMDIWVYDSAQKTLKQVTQSANARYPVWLSLPLDGPPRP